MSDLKTITYRPGAGEYAWTFGGAAPVMRLRTPCGKRRVVLAAGCGGRGREQVRKDAAASQPSD